jgi:hypothetical protein
MAPKKNKNKRALAACPRVADLVTLSLGSPIFDGNSLVRGLIHLRSDGVSDASENDERYGYRIPDGKVLVVTGLSYYSGFTQPEPPGNLTRLFLGRISVTEELIQNQNLFVTTAVFSNNGSIGGNVSVDKGFVLQAGHFLSASFCNYELLSPELFVYGYLASQGNARSIFE